MNVSKLSKMIIDDIFILFVSSSGCRLLLEMKFNKMNPTSKVFFLMISELRQ